MKIALSGSMQFAKDFLIIKTQLEKVGHTVIVPANTEKYSNNIIKQEDKWSKLDNDVIKEYFEEIKKVDAVLIINKDKNNIPNYVGGNGLIEMAFAHILGKKIFLWRAIPQMSYTDEIIAMNPVIIQENINIIK